MNNHVDDKNLISREQEQQDARRVTTPVDDPIVQACIDSGGHYWPEGESDEPRTCTRCWYNPGWASGKPRDERSARPVTDDPAA